MKCPNCGKKLKGVLFNVGKTYTVRCECDTRVTIAQDLFTEKIIDWQTPEEQKGGDRCSK